MNSNKQSNSNKTNIEKQLLGAIMLEKGIIDTVYPRVSPEHFSIDAHRTIYNTMLELLENHKPIDILTVTDKLRAANQLEPIGARYVTFLTTVITPEGCEKTNLENLIKILTSR